MKAVLDPDKLIAMLATKSWPFRMRATKRGAMTLKLDGNHKAFIIQNTRRGRTVARFFGDREIFKMLSDAAIPKHTSQPA